MTFAPVFQRTFSSVFDRRAAVAAIVTSGLVLHYDAAVTGEANTVVDLAGAGAPDGVLNGSYPKLATGAPTAYKLEANNNVSVTETATLRIAQPTVEIWAYLVSGTKTAPPWGSPITQESSLVSYSMLSSPYYRYQIQHISNTNTIKFRISIGATLYNVTAEINKPQWVHLVGTYDGNTILLYINGYEAARNETPSGDISWGSYSQWNIGTWNNDTQITTYSETNYPGNKWSIVRLYNRALTANEVYQNWTAQRSRFGFA